MDAYLCLLAGHGRSGRRLASNNDATLEQFLDARGTLAKSSSVETSDPSDPASPTHPWLPFTADWCSVPASCKVNLFQIILNALSRDDLDVAQYITQEPKFGGVKVPFYYGCLRHDFNWRNLHRVKHHLQYDNGSVWNRTVRDKADERLKQDLIALCNANQYGEPKVPANWNWTLPTDDDVRKCEEIAGEFEFGVSTVLLTSIRYIH